MKIKESLLQRLALFRSRVGSSKVRCVRAVGERGKVGGGRSIRTRTVGKKLEEEMSKQNEPMT
eukprot:766480-Hanusia_phi.AAC.12